MATNIDDIGEMHSAAKNLLDKVVLGTADNILNKLDAGIENLKNSWRGSDAGTNIDNLIEVYNGIAVFRNSLARLAVAVADTAVYYDHLQLEHGGTSVGITKLDFSEKSPKESYSDSSTGISINAAAIDGKNNIDSANRMYSEFLEEANQVFDNIKSIWVEGGEHDAAVDAFNTFKQKTDEYTEILNTVSSNITTVLENYQII